MSGLFRTLKNPFKGPFTAEAPPELLACEFECRARDCDEERWRSCSSRIRLMNDAIAFTQASQAGCQGGTGASSPEDGGSLPALYMKYYRAIS